MPSFKPLFILLWSFLKWVLHGIGRVQSFLILTVIYIFFFGTVALLARLFRRDLLEKQIRSAPTFWVSKPEETLTLEQAKQPF